MSPLFYLTDPVKDSSRQPDKFQGLIRDLRKTLGPASGIDSEDVDSVVLERLMREYISRPCEWINYAFQDRSRNYTRNLVDEGNGKCNLLILAWTPNKQSPIHDHANSHCIMKVLQGCLRETLFDWPEKGQESPLKVKKATVFHKDDVTYMSDKLGLHRISNDGNEIAVSLHLYTPPNAASYGCHIYDEASGRPSHVTLCNYFSMFGVKVKD